MSIFDKFIKKVTTQHSIPLYSPERNSYCNSFGKPLDRLEDGDLPWGWVSANHEFTSKIENEYSCFLKCWVDSRTKSPKEQFVALRALLQYISDVKNLCTSKNECYILWCNNYLLNDEHVKKLNDEFRNLSANLDVLQTEYENKMSHLATLDQDLYDFILNHPGILQKEVYKQFPADVKDAISGTLYNWDKEGRIKREKSGNSYIINCY